jgi:methionine-rich copper-binding protein CopC
MHLRSIPAALAATAAAMTAAAPSLAHAPVTGRTPAPGSTASGVRAVKVRFGESVVTGLIDVRRAGRTVTATSAGLNRRNHAVLQATFARPLPRGSYEVSWRARADDGHSEHGSWRFSVR